jgi:hypothetical protein
MPALLQADWGLCRAGGGRILRHMSEKPVIPAEPAAGGDKPPAKPVPQPAARPAAKPEEFGGPPGPEPTRYGDWERGGRCVDF